VDAAINNAVSNVLSHLDDASNDPYALNIISYALTLAHTSEATDALRLLSTLAINEGSCL